MQSVDGDVRLSVGFDTENVRQEAKRLGRDVDKALQGDGKNDNSKMMGLKNQLKQTSDKAQELSKTLDKLGAEKVPTQEYNEISTQIQKANIEFDKLLEKQEALQREGKTSGKTWDEIQYKMEEASNTIHYAQGELDDLVQTGKAFKMGSETDEYTKTAKKLDIVNDKTRLLLKRTEETGEKAKEAGKKANKSIEKTNNNIKRTNKNVLGLNRSLKHTHKNMDKTFKKGVLMFLRWGIGVESVFALIRLMRQSITEGFGNLSQFDKNIKGQLDTLKASFLTLKNTIAAAFSPLVTVALPYIQKVVNSLINAVSLAGQFIAAIMGKKTYTKAIKQSAGAVEDEADALKDAKKAAEGYLSPIDEINKFTSKDKDSGSKDKKPAAGGGLMFEEVPIDTKVLDYLDRIKKKLQPILDYIKELKEEFKTGFFEGLGDWEYRWDSIKRSIKSIKDSLKDIFTDPQVLASIDRYVKSCARTLGAFAGSLASVGLTIATNLFGGLAKYLEQNKDRLKEKLIKIFDIGTEVNELFEDLFVSIAEIFEAFASEDAQQLTANIIGIFSDLTLGLSELLLKFGRDMLSLFVTPLKENVDGLKQGLENLLTIFMTLTGTIKSAVQETMDKLNEMYDEHIKPAYDELTRILSELTGEITDFWNEGIAPILQTAMDVVDEVWKEHVQPVVNLLIDELGEFFTFMSENISDLWDNYLKPLIDWIKKYILPVIVPIVKACIKVVGTELGVAFDLLGTLLTFLKDIRDFMQNVFKGDWSEAWESAKKTVTDVWDGISKTISGAVDKIKGIIGELGDAFDKLRSKVKGESSSSKFGFSSGFHIRVPHIGRPNIPSFKPRSLPKYASGQVIPVSMKQHAAILGDNNRETEVVSPLSTMKQAMMEALKEMGTTQNTNIKLYLDGQQLTEAVVRNGRLQQMSTGTNVFELA